MCWAYARRRRSCAGRSNSPGSSPRTRGINRFAIFLHTLEQLARRPEFLAARLPCRTRAPSAWVHGPGPLSAERLERDLADQPDEAMRLALEWSRAVTRCVELKVRRVDAFAGAAETLAEMAKLSDLVVVSATQRSALDRDWRDHGMQDLPLAIAGSRGDAGRRSPPPWVRATPRTAC
ncbi:MAG: hypothetical protein U1F77_09900 [Kiritimatiellia bacterium]